ncbi:Benzoate 4-monooxygenase [Lasiodiplodia theobromae]|uniref:Benzoate 4-monooxygenase n=1 Tax=Lasiodiplodia theobromae TaxID=45133 RepID=A0A5N5D394_9PEZI|nr:Benzoate 4-monooxygenase [Lasiodiplodia theobromae]
MYGIAVFVLLPLFLFLRFIVHPIYLYFSDPKGLRRYPNFSPLARITNIPYMIESASGERSKRLTALHKKHPVLRVGPNALSYGDVRAIKDIYGHGTKCLKDDMYVLQSGTHFHLADVIDKGEHARKRKVLSSAYAIKNLEEWEYKIADKVQRLVHAFDARCTAPLPPGGRPDEKELTVDYRRWTNFFTMDAIVDIGLSERLGCLDRGDDVVASEAVDGKITMVPYIDAVQGQLTAQSHLVWAYGWYRALHRLARWLSPKYRRWIAVGDHFDGIVLHQVRNRMRRYEAGEEKLEDFFQALMETKDGVPQMLPLGEINAECSIMLNAGSVSTAVAINNVLYNLLKHPHCLSTLRTEIDTVADPDEVVIPYDKLKNLPYLRACLDESMRIAPPTPFGLPRKTPPEGTTVFGEYVAGNTSVHMSSYVAHRDEKAFAEPEEFRPERWLGAAGKELQPWFITFSAGARGCIGRNISYLEQVVVTASMVHRYEFALPGEGWEQSKYEHFNLNPGPLPLKIWRREVEVEES